MSGREAGVGGMAQGPSTVVGFKGNTAQDGI